MSRPLDELAHITLPPKPLCHVVFKVHLNACGDGLSTVTPCVTMEVIMRDNKVFCRKLWKIVVLLQ